MKTKINLWPFGIVLAFVIFFVGMASVVVIASTHRENLVTKNYYEDELKFQSRIDDSARAQKSGATISFDAANRRVVIALPVAQLTNKFSGTIQLYRPSAPELDRELALELNSDGTQTLNLSKLAPGAWQIRIRWSADGENYFLEQKITVAGN